MPGYEQQRKLLGGRDEIPPKERRIREVQKSIFILLIFMFAASGCNNRPIYSTPAHITSSDVTEISISTQKDEQIFEQCIIAASNLAIFSNKDYGTIIIDRDNTSLELYQKLAKPYLYKPHINEKISIDGYGFSVSLDSTMYAYTTDENMLFVANNDGKIISKKPIQYEYISHWVNNGLILQSGNGHMFLNPFNGERKKLIENLPNRYIPQGFGGIYQYVSFDPTLTRALYFAWDQDGHAVYFSLWDIPNHKEIARIPQLGFTDVGFPAEWSSDGEQTILRVWEGGDRFTFLRIHKDGAIETVLNENGFSYALSPDNEKLAFWLHDQDKEMWDLSIADLYTKQVINYCIESKYFPITPIWSPDSHNLLIELITDAANSVVVLIDLVKNLAVQIGEDAKPVGWLK